MADDSATTATDAPADPEAADTEAAAEAEELAEVDERREALLAELREPLGDAVIDTHVDPGRDVWARVSLDSWALTAEVVRHRMGARYFGFLSAIDWMPSPFGRSMDAEVDKAAAAAEGSGDEDDDAPEETMRRGVTGGASRFQMLARVAKVGDPGDHWGITLKADIPDSDAGMDVATWTNTYAGADWHEREAWEMYGINFVGHPGLRHIYLPGDFEGFPLRKDYPLIARIVKPWPGIVDVEALPEVADVNEPPASGDAPAEGAASAEGEQSADGEQSPGGGS